MNTITEIRNAIKASGGLDKFSSYDRRNRPCGCPRKSNMNISLQELTKEEIHIAFRMGLIGNNARKGSIVENSIR